MPGKYWSKEEEQQLQDLWNSGVHDKAKLAKKLDRPELAIDQKLRRMGLVVINTRRKITTTSVLPKGLLTHEEALKILSGALQKLTEKDLDRTELDRLATLVDAAKTYDGVLEKFEKWVDLEQRLLKVEKWIEENNKKAETVVS